MWVHLTPDGQATMHKASQLLLLQKLAYVLNGTMVGHEVTISGPMDGAEMAISVSSRTGAFELENRFKRYLSARD